MADILNGKAESQKAAPTVSRIGSESDVVDFISMPRVFALR
jgi:hypothetical protein